MNCIIILHFIFVGPIRSYMDFFFHFKVFLKYSFYIFLRNFWKHQIGIFIFCILWTQFYTKLKKDNTMQIYFFIQISIFFKNKIKRKSKQTRPYIFSFLFIFFYNFFPQNFSSRTKHGAYGWIWRFISWQGKTINFTIQVLDNPSILDNIFCGFEKYATQAW